MSQEKERMSKDKQENGRAPGAAPESPNAGPLAPGQRWSLARKRDVALRLLRSEPVDALSRTLGVEIYVLDDWRDLQRSRESRHSCSSEVSHERTPMSASGKGWRGRDGTSTGVGGGAGLRVHDVEDRMLSSRGA